MKKNLHFIITASLFILIACTEKTKTLEQFYQDEKIENIDQIIIRDGTTGATKTITNEEQINQFLSLINEIQFTPQKNQEKREGWLYGITLFDGEEQFQFTLSKINDVYYDSNPDIYPIVDKYYKQLDILEE